MLAINRTLLVGCLLLANTASAQTPSQNQNEDKTDYRVVGAPMPRLKVLLYHDTVKRAAVMPEEVYHKARKYKKKKATAMGSQVYLTEKDVDN